ncbi:MULTISPECIES: condensation domain-containing protein [unclassified Vibrio]|uniref:Condensation domain-containing protein n=1 Tax=Vibrio sp. HB236076 TaxID=3232307 RepID=A0AB39H8Q9_9VIBR|nr:condensation domain-containing protein [Vibrio sp. HB161653]MDP5253794.1 condensation domain-containing protein [Vibrio sp. HB161653]
MHTETTQPSTQASTLSWHALTLPQMDFWEEFDLHPDEPLSTVAHYIELTGPVDLDALCQSIEAAVRETDVLALTFRKDPQSGQVQQAISEPHYPIVKVIDLSENETPLAKARTLMEDELKQPINLYHDKLSAQWVIKLADDHYLWYLRAHHIIMDGFGMTLLEQRCATWYAHFQAGQDCGRPFNRLNQFLSEENAYQSSPLHQQSQQFWHHYLQQPNSVTALDKADDYEEESVALSARLDTPFSQTLIDAAKFYGIAWADLLVVLSGLYLHHHLSAKYCPHDDPLTLWVPFMSRWGSVGAYMPGMMVNILPFTLSVDESAPLHQQVKHHSQALRQLYRHGRFRIEQMAKDQGIKNNHRYFFSPFINVLPFDPPAFHQCETTHHVLTSGPADGFNLTFRGQTNGYGLSMSLDSDASLHPETEMLDHQNNLMTFLQRCFKPSNAEQKLHDLFSPQR